MWLIDEADGARPEVETVGVDRTESVPKPRTWRWGLLIVGVLSFLTMTTSLAIVVWRESGALGAVAPQTKVTTARPPSRPASAPEAARPIASTPTLVSTAAAATYASPPSQPTHRPTKSAMAKRNRAAVNHATPARKRRAVERGVLLIATNPVFDIAVDGKATGLRTPQDAIELPAGVHRVALTNEHGARHLIELTISPNRTTRLVRDFPTR